jgi:hypothetical protein
MKYEHIGWCKEDNHDKVWGIILLAEDVPTSESAWPFRTNKYVSFWGRRGAKLQTKLFTGTSYEALKMFEKKENKGYKSVERDELNEVYPEFQTDLEKTAFWATLKI